MSGANIAYLAVMTVLWAGLVGWVVWAYFRHPDFNPERRK